jgi:hypothetical protein
MELQKLLEEMWLDYCKLNPQVKAIYDFLTDRGEQPVNDHIALRTFRAPGLGITPLAATFVDLGYKKMGDYTFPEKKLFAEHFEPGPELPPHSPKVFISELILDDFSLLFRQTIQALLRQMPPISGKMSPLMGRPWRISYSQYELLAKESEYASWVAAHGFRPNHFTVFVNSLKTFSSLEELNTALESQGFVLNTSGGKIKGSPKELLEQSSTMAAKIPVRFDDGVFEIPGCYYEFARRYPDASGKLYQGFIPSSADKIFESTNRMPDHLTN